jgi:hypothetical protein
LSITQIPGGSFNDSPHEYRDEAGAWVPSLTQVLRLQGLSADYGGISEDVMENAARRGTEVHQLAAAYNQFGEVDPGWITPETEPYFDAYLAFLKDTNFKPDPEWSERNLIATIYGFKIGITPDCHGTWGRTKAIIELKCTSSRHRSWELQTGLQEMGVYHSNVIGRVRRFALMLMKTGKYNLGKEHTNHEYDAANGIAALRNVWWRIEDGQDLRKLLQGPAG